MYFGVYDNNGEINIFDFVHFSTDDMPYDLWSQVAPESGARYCYNNTINIDWNPDNGGATIQNMCYYDGGIDIPEDPVKPGYTFTGWKLVE